MIGLATEAPWWGVPFVAGIFAFIGVLLAQSVGVYSARRAESAADRRRWHDERRGCYATFLRAIRQIEFGASGPNDIERETHDRLLNECEQAYNEIELLGADQTVELVADLYSDGIELWAQTVLINRGDSTASEADSGLRESVKRDRLALLAAIRSELGIVQAPKGSTVLHATKPYEILREAAKIAFNIQVGASEGIFNALSAGVAVLVQQIAVIVTSCLNLITTIATRRRGK